MVCLWQKYVPRRSDIALFVMDIHDAARTGSFTEIPSAYRDFHFDTIKNRLEELELV